MLFDNILYINLLRRPDRNQNVVDHLTKHGLIDMANRIDAVDGKTLDLNSISDIITSQGINEATGNLLNMPYTSLTRGGIGCAMSHRRCYEEILRQNKSALILEDDIALDDDFNNKLSEYEKHFPQDADIIFLGYHPSRKMGKLNMINDVCGIPNKMYGLFGYVVTEKGAQKLMNMFPITKQIDTEISSRLKNMNVYALSPDKKIIKSDLSQQADRFGSDIQTNTILTKGNLKIIIPIIVIIAIFIFIFIYFSKSR